ncbi:MAG: ABC transporter ATP-binding protein/permease [Candidatus Saccharibacteria bacterium]|nr:ABC transporter ATP-binding protein/permease [Candidatus Saccharibacteria bacterium]
MLEMRGVSKVYETGGIRRVVLNKVTINFRESEFAAILGPSGSGKTTLLNIIGGLDKYSSGDLTINEKTTKKFRDKDWDAYRNHRIGFVFQSYNLIPHQSVLQNVRLALTLSGISKRESVRRAKKALKEVGLEEHINKLPAQLSGGQMQRVAIARALVNDPDILLADEPTGALDSETSVQVMDLLKKIAANKLVIMVTHNPDLAKEYATRIIKLKDGKIVADSNPYDGKIKTDLSLIESEKKSKKTKMSFLTAFGLSMRNLLTKKARTILVAIAGSIGIIGIALISAVSTGFQNYIDKIEEDTLTSYPLRLQKETADLTGILLSLTGESTNGTEEGKLKENQILTSTLGTVSNNDLPSFASYLESHKDEVKDDVRLVEYEFNVDPVIYTKDAVGEIAKMNPSNMFSSLVGETSLLRNYSTMTSVFRQFDPENLRNNTEILAGRYPEKYNELMVVLNNRNQISELLTYSLGFHDSQELNKIITKIMSGERVDVKNEPLELDYQDLMDVDLRLMPATDLYKFNAKYDVYEDMTGDKDYMGTIYNSAEKLHIVGVAVVNSDMMASGSGVAYLPSLISHIIENAGKSEIVKKQLANPEVDVFSNTKFGEEGNDFNFEFSDLVSVDEAKLAQAFGINIDQNAVTAKTSEYIQSISNDITADISPVKTELTERFKILSDKLKLSIAGLDGKGTFMKAEIDAKVDEFIASEVFSDLEAKYLIPADNFRTTFSGLLKGLLTAYVTAFDAAMQKQGIPYDVETMPIPIVDLIFNPVVEQYLQAVPVDSALDSFAIAITEITMKKEILTKVGDLTGYLTNSFASAFNVNSDAIIGAFKLNFTEEELSRVVTAMFTKKKSTLATNLSALGYQGLDDPTTMAFYFWSFDGKTSFMEFLDNYNERMRELKMDDKVIEYTDTTGVLMSSVKVIVDAVSYVLIAFVSISLVVSSIMIGVITYISVYERTKEIGILRAIGASKHNISSIFNAETFIIGLLSGLFGVVASYLFIPIINLILHHFTGDIPLSAYLDPKMALFLIVLSVVLTLIGGLIPARSASKKNPVEALRSE